MSGIICLHEAKEEPHPGRIRKLHPQTEGEEEILATSLGGTLGVGHLVLIGNRTWSEKPFPEKP